MSEHFRAEATMHTQDVNDILVPRQVGVGVLNRSGDGEKKPSAVLGLSLVGAFVDAPDTDLALIVALDTERSVGLIVQLRSMLLDAGVSPGQIVAMMKEAYARLDELAARGQPPSFRCPVCGMVTYNVNDIANGYCDNCHDWTKEKAP